MRFLTSSIRTKIIFPYILLTLIVGMAGAYVATRLVFSTTLERLENQLLGAGRVASKTILDQELERLATLRSVAQTIGTADALVDQDYARLQSLIVPIANNDAHVDSIVVLNDKAVEVFKLNRTETETFFPPEINAGTSYAEWASVINQVLLDQPSELGDKYTVLAQDQSSNRDLIYSVGPMRQDGRVVGVVLIGNYLERVLDEIRLKSLADITFYAPGGEVRYTTFSESQPGVRDILKIAPELYQQVIANTDATEKEKVTLLGQEYSIAFAPFQLRGETLGVYSVGLVANSVIASGNISRNIFSLIIFFAITVLMIIAYIVTQQIIRPLARLVKISGSVAAGDLTRQTGIASHDEIGRLATSFDQMTAELRRRTEQLQELVREREEEASKVRAILSSIADGVLVQDRNGQIIEMNRAAERTINQLTPFYPDPLKEIVANVPTVEEEIRRFELADRTFDARTAYVITHQNEILGSVVVLRDITLEIESDRLKRKFIEAISHELLTPLVPIKGYLNLLRMLSQGEAFSRHQALIDTVSLNVEDLHNLVSTLVDVSQIEAGELSLDTQPFDFNDMVSKVGESYKEKMGDENLTFRIHLTETPLTIEGDKHRLQRVLRGLLENALYYNRPEGAVDLYLSQENGHARVDVVDTGTGIEDSLKPYIFKTLFVRGSARGPDTVRGTGAQLYLARVIVEEHHGQIWFESGLNQGSKFSFIIPLCTNDDFDGAARALNDGGYH